MLLLASDVQTFGLDIMKVRRGRKSEKALLNEFRMHFGSSPLDIASCWYDLCNHDDNLLSEKEKSQKGFIRFMAAQYWLWCRPKNAKMFASRFGLCVDYCLGEGLWKWIRRVAKLSEDKHVWPKWLDSKKTEWFGITADGVDFKLWERQHPDYPMDSKAMSHKFKSCGAKYIIALSTFQSKCVYIAGPFRGGKPDLDIFRECGLMDKLKSSNKVCIADRGFRSKLVHELEVFAYPDYMDSKELHNFKSRARCRQESYNRRLKHFECLSGTFTNGFEKHGVALRAVAVMVQYQMDNGSPLYSV